jgi:hypothetical protein
LGFTTARTVIGCASRAVIKYATFATDVAIENSMKTTALFVVVAEHPMI